MTQPNIDPPPDEPATPTSWTSPTTPHITLKRASQTPLVDVIYTPEATSHKGVIRQHTADRGASSFTIWVLSDRTTPIATFQSPRSAAAGVGPDECNRPGAAVTGRRTKTPPSPLERRPLLVPAFARSGNGAAVSPRHDARPVRCSPGRFPEVVRVVRTVDRSQKRRSHAKRRRGFDRCCRAAALERDAARLSRRPRAA